MARRHRTIAPPYIRLDSQSWAAFNWHVNLNVHASGYVTMVSVTAFHKQDAGAESGSAWMWVQLGDDVQVAIEACLIEASAMASEVPLFVCGDASRQLQRAEVFG